jgi:endonuclease YncB( thermonuclease family)
LADSIVPCIKSTEDFCCITDNCPLYGTCFPEAHKNGKKNLKRQKRKTKSSKYLSILIIILLFLASCSYASLTDTVSRVSELTAPSNPAYETAIVTRVVDGDTIVANINGTEYKVRYIGMDTPETVDPRKPVQFMGKEASAKNKELVDGRTVKLEKDVSNTDRYGRLLRYVYVEQNGQWIMVNAELVKLGFAQVATYPPDVKYQSMFLDLQRQAKEQNLGLWVK